MAGGGVYFRLVLGGSGGRLLGSSGGQRRQWQWSDVDNGRHVHAPPLYPLNVPLSRHASLLISSQFDIKLTFSCAQRTCSFDVAAERQVRTYLKAFHTSSLVLSCTGVWNALDDGL